MHKQWLMIEYLNEKTKILQMQKQYMQARNWVVNG